MATDKHQPVIGTVTTYLASSPALGGRGARVKVIGIFKAGEPEDSEDAVVRDDLRLARLGGVRAEDSADVLVWNAVAGRWGWVGTEVEDVTELELFRHLKRHGEHR